MKNKWIRILVIISICLSSLALDQITKIIAINNLVEYKSVPVIKDFFYWTLCYNTGGAWSIFSNSTWMLVVISVLALGMIIFTLVKSKSKMYDVAAALFIGGLLGNLLDRVIQGKVTDFLDFMIFGYDFPVFNVADICICVSAVFIVWAILKEEKKDGTKDSE